MMPLINHLSLAVAHISRGKSMSAGAMLLACGTKGYRYAGKDSTIMIHEVSAMSYGKLSDMKNSIEETDRLNKLIFSKIDKCCGQKSGFFTKLLNKHGNVNLFLTAAEAKSYKLVDHIGVPDFKVDVSVNTELVI